MGRSKLPFPNCSHMFSTVDFVLAMFSRALFPVQVSTRSMIVVRNLFDL